MLHAPLIGYTLVSLKAEDSLGYCIAISSRHLETQLHAGERLVHVTQTTHGLYHISHKGEGGYAVEVVSIMELHRRMGNIAPTSVHKLVEDGLVTGIALDPNSQEEHCEVGLFAHTTRQPVLRLRVSVQAKQFGDEIHTNVFGDQPQFRLSVINTILLPSLMTPCVSLSPTSSWRRAMPCLSTDSLRPGHAPKITAPRSKSCVRIAAANT